VKRDNKDESGWRTLGGYRGEIDCLDKGISDGGGDRRTLERLREEIDSLDQKMLSLLEKRQEVAVTIGQIKRSLGIEVFDPAREQEVLRHLASTDRGYLKKQAIKHVFGEVISAARSVQAALTVAFLGPDATFSHQAAIGLFGHSASYCAAESIEEVFGLVEKGLCQQGVIPIENSYEGFVTTTSDLLYRYELNINAEIFLRIRHYLLSNADHIGEVTHIYSHPMPIAQCWSWIRNHLPGIPIKEVESTSLAATMAAKEPDAAAVGSRLCAVTYGIKILEENIEDYPNNVTRFLAIGKTEAAPTRMDKTSLLFLVSHRPGSLNSVLEPLAQRNINMTRIESRPLKIRNWEYFFFVDIEGHVQESNVHEAFKEMEERCLFFKRLGSYPAGSDAWD
jgi:chorismate mutase/prephenate dehydratase